MAFLAELAVVLELQGVALELNWVPRDQNEEADALSNEEFSAFTAANQIPVQPDKLPFKVLGKLLDLGESFYAERDAIKDRAKEAKDKARLAVQAKSKRKPGSFVGATPKWAPKPKPGKKKRAMGDKLRLTDPW